MQKEFIKWYSLKLNRIIKIKNINRKLKLYENFEYIDNSCDKNSKN